MLKDDSVSLAKIKFLNLKTTIEEFMIYKSCYFGIFQQDSGSSIQNKNRMYTRITNFIISAKDLLENNIFWIR